jgi:hypothetical protein
MSQSQRSARRPSRAIGFLAALGVFPRVEGSGAPGVRASRLVLFVLVAALGVFALGSASALAAAPETPEPHLNTRYSTELFFYGYLNPNAAGEAGTYKFLYKASTTGACEGGGETTAGIALGERQEVVRETISGLAQDTTYAVCLVAEDKDGRAVSAPLTVTTTITVETPQALAPEPLTDTTATLHGLLNPAAAREPEPGRYEFRYRQSGSECEGGDEQRTREANALGHEREAVEASLIGLAPATQYTFCLYARNEETEGATSSPVTFTTGPEGSATEVSSDGATLHAVINPQGAATTYAFEYATAGGTYTPVSGGAGTIPAGIAPVSLSVPVQHLEGSTLYQFRLKASNTTVGTVTTPPVTFTTQATGGEFELPDNRSYELVSPPNRDGALLEAITSEGGVIESAENGSAFTYVAKTPPLAKAEGNPAYGYSQMMATRGEDGGWSNRDIAVPRTETNGVYPHILDEYFFFTPELTSSILDPLDETELAPGETEETIFIANGLRDGGTREYDPLVNAHNTPPGTHYGRIPRTISGGRQMLYGGASSNLEHVVIDSKQPLTASPAGFTEEGLYEWTKSTGELRPVSVLPSGEWATGSHLGHGGGGAVPQVQGAISGNGEKVFWSASPSEGELYVTDFEDDTTTLINPVKAGENEDAVFQYATPDGSKVYFTSYQKLTANSTANFEEPELYEYNTGTGKTTDLTPDPEGTSANVRTEVLGISSDGEYVYFVAEGKLASGATAGDDNLYVEHAGATRWIATLSGEDDRDWTGTGGENADLLKRTARISPSGRYLTFMSDQSLTGYDNDDAVSGVPDEEVYLYDAESGHLVCASCDPSGARPHGVLDQQEAGEGLGLLVDRPGTWNTGAPGVDHWLAGSIPGWTAWEQHAAEYQSRYLTNEGRLFFNSADGLVPQDTNGKEDVYEYEPEGVGPEAAKCGPESLSGSEVYKREGPPGDEAAGCVALISSGKSSQESAFLDASAKGPGGEEGEDVFFLSSAQLTGQEVESGGDIYDAHICSSQSPCASTAVLASPPCTNEESCRAAPAPQPAIFGSPASATFSGPGNITSTVTPTVTTKKKTAAELKAEKLTKALKACRTKKNKQKRQACEKQARAKYGTSKPKAKKAKKTSNDRGTK